MTVLELSDKLDLTTSETNVIMNHYYEINGIRHKRKVQNMDTTEIEKAVNKTYYYKLKNPK